MKTKTTIATVAALLLIVFANITVAQEKKAKSKECLEVKLNVIIDNDLPFEGAVVKIFDGNDVIYTIDDENASEYLITLEENKYYTMEVSYDEFLTRRVAISTKLPSGVKHELLYRHEISISMVREGKSVNQDQYDFPAGMITYNPKSDLFESNRRYIASLKEPESSTKMLTASK